MHSAAVRGLEALYILTETDSPPTTPTHIPRLTAGSHVTHTHTHTHTQTEHTLSSSVFTWLPSVQYAELLGCCLAVPELKTAAGISVRCRPRLADWLHMLRSRVEMGLHTDCSATPCWYADLWENNMDPLLLIYSFFTQSSRVWSWQSLWVFDIDRSF